MMGSRNINVVLSGIFPGIFSGILSNILSSMFTCKIILIILILTLLQSILIGASNPACPTANNFICSGHGECVDINTVGPECSCNSGYAGSDCNYQLKSKKLAIILSASLGYFGADRLYLGYETLWIVKMTLGFIGIICGIILLVLACIGIFKREENKNCCVEILVCSAVIVVGSFLTILIWYFVDLILIITDKLKDSNNYPLSG